MNGDNQYKPLVTIITATIGRDCLARCIESVRAQTYPNIQHFIVIDGKERESDARNIIAKFEDEEGRLTGTDVLCLPYPTRGYGLRVYASAPHLTKGDFILNLDDDNTIVPDHVESLMEAIGDHPWAYTLRNITKNGVFVARDDCASLGPLHPLWDAMKRGETETFIDTNCYLFRRKTAVELYWNWPDVPFNAEPYPNDRKFYAVLIRRYPDHGCTYKYTVNYEVHRHGHWEYIEEGNRWMRGIYGEDFPWHSASKANDFLIQQKKENIERVAMLEKTASQKPSADNFANLSFAYFQTERWQECIDAAKEALKLNPNYSPAWNNICCASNILGRFEEGKKAGEEALRIAPDDRVARKNLEWAIQELEGKKREFITGI